MTRAELLGSYDLSSCRLDIEIPDLEVSHGEIARQEEAERQEEGAEVNQGEARRQEGQEGRETEHDLGIPATQYITAAGNRPRRSAYSIPCGTDRVGVWIVFGALGF